MPSYELSLIFKALRRPELVQAIKRSSEAILNQGGIVRGFENLGMRSLPYRMFKHGAWNKEGNYFLIYFDSRADALPTIRDQLKRDLDIVKPSIFRQEVELGRPCESGPCDFGELTKESWKRSRIHQKTLNKKL